ncbi:MAG: hypothetical protein LBN07_02950 [Christensenellaceae bacterium]|jgi:hypothetical protein|nr:hypothetical protein [Christensenellaceae bacterium]
MKNNDDNDTIEINDKEKKSGILDELNEAAEEVEEFFKKVGNKLAQKSNEINQNYRHNRDKNTILKETLKTYDIAGLDVRIKVFEGSENEHAIYIRQDDKNLEKVLSGTILIDEDNKKILITQINKNSLSQKKLIVGEQEELFPCFRAEYKIYDAAKPKIDKIDYKE